MVRTNGWRGVLGMGVVGGVLIAAMRFTEYRFLVLEHSVEMYGGLVAAVFSGLGIWLGVRLVRPRAAVAEKQVLRYAQGDKNFGARASLPFVADERKRVELGLTRREVEVLGLMAEGLSNREMAERLFVSENTIKTHCSRAFEKLGAKRRTQAVQMGKELGVIG